MANVLHVTPVGDLIDHDGSTGWLIVHHSLDARERSERQ